jgi:cell wall-associated NlpC family hydrolase
VTASDLRLTPARPDLAAAHLRGRVTAARFVDGRAMVVAAGHAPLRAAPRDDAPLQTEALRGEPVAVYEEVGGWAWGQLGDDRYVGWLPAAALATPGAAPTHCVAAPLTLVFPEPTIKAPPVARLPMAARVAVVEIAGRLARLEDGGYVPAIHLEPLAAPTAGADFAAIAERFLGAPYLWGGKTAVGIDCSGLVQVSLAMVGTAAPRDSDLQEAALGQPVAEWSTDTLRRGDLLFWPGHVAIALGPGLVIHANAHHMAVAVEDAAAAVQRIAAAGSLVRTVRRLSRRPA